MGKRKLATLKVHKSRKGTLPVGEYDVLEDGTIRKKMDFIKKCQFIEEMMDERYIEAEARGEAFIEVRECHMKALKCSNRLRPHSMGYVYFGDVMHIEAPKHIRIIRKRR